ncbi:MAG: DUF4405 domain-containing protein [Clostridia bacterium]|nr:DUF4405 domain-containing protein [Clostridia bacterium]
MKQAKTMRKVKIGLDILLTAGMLTLFDKSLFGVFYHEVAGVVVTAAVLIHILINLRAVTGMVKKFCKVPLNVKLCLAVDVLLLVWFATIGVTGVMISKKLFAGLVSGAMLAKALHYAASGMAVLGLGVHLGLHVGRKAMHRVVACVLTAVFLGAGVWGLATSSTLRWMAMPFTQQGGGRPGEYPGFAGKDGVSGNAFPEGFIVEDDFAPDDPTGGGKIAAEGAEETANSETAAEALEEGAGRGRDGKGLGRNFGNGKGLQKGMQKSWGERALSVARFGGIMGLATMATYWAMRLAKRKKSK